MKRNIVQVTTKKRDYTFSHWNTMWNILTLYVSWNLINIKRIHDPEEYPTIKY